MADDKDLKAKEAAFNHPLFVPDAFKEWLQDFALRVSTDFYGQDIQGLRGARWKTGNPVGDPEVCNDTSSWSSLATRGPMITGLSDGIWLFVWGFENPQANYHSSVLLINGAFADGKGLPGNHSTNEVRNDGGGSAMGWAIYFIDGKTPAPGQGQPSVTHGGSNNNTVECVYGVTVAGQTFGRRFLHAIRIDDA